MKFLLITLITHVASTSQDAAATYRPIIEARLAAQRYAGFPVVFESVEDSSSEVLR
jgi:hypothetical protein